MYIHILQNTYVCRDVLQGKHRPLVFGHWRAQSLLYYEPASNRLSNWCTKTQSSTSNIARMMALMLAPPLVNASFSHYCCGGCGGSGCQGGMGSDTTECNVGWSRDDDPTAASCSRYYLLPVLCSSKYKLGNRWMLWIKLCLNFHSHRMIPSRGIIIPMMGLIHSRYHSSSRWVTKGRVGMSEHIYCKCFFGGYTIHIWRRYLCYVDVIDME